jgi:ribonuclease D
VGVATDFDVKQLQEIHAFSPSSFINLETLTDELGIVNNGLRSLTAIVLGFRISKGEQRSNWSRSKLTDRQIRYAATDAWVSREIYLRLAEALKAKSKGGGNGSHTDPDRRESRRSQEAR